MPRIRENNIRYTKAQINETSKAVVDALYKRQTIREAREQITDKDRKIYINFNDWVGDLRKRLDGKRVHLAFSLNFAKVIYELLTVEDKEKLLLTLKEEVRYNKEHYGTPSISMRKWIKEKEKSLTQKDR